MHSMSTHQLSCADAGLRVEAVCEPRVDFHHPDRGVSAVLAVRARRRECAGLDRAR
jgi:hypothetical protein